MSKKVAKVNKSDVVIEVTPDTSDESLVWDAHWDVIQQGIRDVKIEGLRWAKDFGLVEFVFGMKKLMVVCQIIDSKVESTAPVVEAISKIKGVGGAEMLTIETAGSDWDQMELDEINAAKKAAKKDADGAKKEAKKAAKEDKKEAEREVTADMIKSDAQKAAVSCKDEPVYVAGCNLSDGSGSSDLSREQLTEVMNLAHEKAPDTVLMITTAGKSRVAALIVVPPSKAGFLKASEWLSSTQLQIVGDADDSTAYGEYACDAAKDEFPIKIKDVVNSQAFTFLKKNNLIQEEEDDECYGADDALGGDY